MSSLGTFVLLLALSIIILTVLILKCKMHPVFSLLFSAIFLSVSLGNSVVTTMDIINAGFGGTMSGIGVPIILGATLAMAIHDTGAASAIANSFIKMFRGKHLELAPALTAYIMSIPVFGDITIMLTTPIASVLAKRKKISMGTMTMTTNTALGLTHNLVPPTPGILAVALMLGADLGQVIIYGIVISIVALFATWLVFRKWSESEKEFIDPREDFVYGIDTVADNASVDQLLIPMKDAPSGFAAILPLIVPILLISLSSFANAYLPAESFAVTIFAALGNKNVALLIGLILASIVALQHKNSVLENVNKTMSEDKKLNSIWNVIVNNWVERGLAAGIGALMITSMGGAFSKVITTSPVISEMGEVIAHTNFPAILVPFCIAAVLFTAVGSGTTAAMTCAGIVAPMLPILGISPVAAALSGACGCLVFTHANNSGFWISAEYFHLDLKQAFKWQTLADGFAGIVSLILLVMIHAIGLV